MTITFKGAPVTLKGKQLNIGDKMPDFTVCNTDLAPIKGSELTGNRIFLSVPSLDTGVCDIEVKNFNKKAAETENVSIYVVSLDLPFAQVRWCQASKVNNVRILSDYQNRQFGHATGTLIEGICLLTRAIFIVNTQNTVVYAEYVPEITDHPDYDAAFSAL